MNGWNYEPLAQAIIGGLVAAAFYCWVRFEVGEHRARKIEQARSKFKHKPDRT